MIGRAAARECWARQWAAIDPRVEPARVTRLLNDRVDGEVNQLVRDLNGTGLSEGKARPSYAFRDGLIERLDVSEPEGLIPAPATGRPLWLSQARGSRRRLPRNDLADGEQCIGGRR